MKRKDFLQELRKKDKSELFQLLQEKKKEAKMVFVKIKSQKEKNLRKYKNLRKDIARILTCIREKEIAESIKKEVKDENI